jgi:N-acetylmuramoyl-L-alanine amidase
MISRLRRVACAGGSGRRIVGVAVALTCLVAVRASAASPATSARSLFLAAQAQDNALRLALASSPPAPAPSRDAMRQVVTAYQQVVLRHPTSGYCDNALWLAAQLSAETFSRHGNRRDRQTALRLLASLVREYPASPLVSQAQASSARILALASPRQVSTSPIEPPRAHAAAPAAAAQRPGPAGPAAPPPGELVLVRDIRRETTTEGAVVEIEVDGPVVYREERLERPARLFLDLANTRTMEALRDATVSFESGSVRQIRVGRRPNNTTRIVLETSDETRCESRMASGPHRLVISCRDDGEPRFPVLASPPPPPAASAPPAAVVITPRRAAPISAPRVEPGSKLPVQASRPAATDGGTLEGTGAATSASPPTAPGLPSTNGRGGFSMARQLGLRVGRIVIDAGHGGRDPGASGPGYSESALTLDIALRLEKLLAKEPGVEVVLTRRADAYVPLQERTAIANREGADLFVSIHANASRNRNARGVESYLLNFATTPDAAAVAARENASSTLTMSHLNDLVKQIALNSKLDESRDLAGHVQNALVRKLRTSNKGLRDLGVKQAPFVVLVGAAMPSVLVEVAFLTHREEGRLLGTGGYRQRIAESLLDGLRRYLRTLKRPEAIAGGDQESLPDGQPRQALH